MSILLLVNLQATLADSFLADLDELSDNEADVLVSWNYTSLFLCEFQLFLIF